MQEYKRLKPFNSGLFTNLIKGLEVVDKPIKEINIQEAEAVGLTILSRSTDPNKSLYRFNDCGHTDFLQPTHVRRGNIKCRTCHLISDVELANSKGFTLLHRTGNNYRKYLRSCGHIIEGTAQAISLNQSVKCQQCFDVALEGCAKEFGYELVENHGLGRWTIKFKSCGHSKEVHQQQIQRGNAVCRVCSVQEHIEEAKEQGLTYLHSTYDRYNFYKLPCGHDKELRQDHAASGSWKCTECGDSHYTKPSNVYLIRFTYEGFTWLKFGFAKHIGIRTTAYGVPKGSELEILDVVPFDKGYDAMIFEKSIHAKYKHVRYPKSLMVNYHTSNGFTECYPETALGTLQAELESIKGKVDDNQGN